MGYWRIFYIWKIPTCLCWGRLCLLQPSVVYQRPGDMRVMHRILAVPMIALIWKDISGVIPGICWFYSPSLGITSWVFLSPLVPIKPLLSTTSPAPLSAPWYFYSFSYSFFLMLLSLWIATSTTTAFLSHLLTHHDIWMVSHHHLIGPELEVPQDLCLVVLNYLRRCCQYSAKMFLFTMPATWLWHSKWAESWQPLK